jgi:hypothetical protein
MAEAKKPVIRCPGCSREVPLPAEACPDCGFNFREGKVPAPERPAALEPSGRPVIWYLVAAVGVMVLIIVGWTLFGRDEEPPPPPAAGGGSILQPLPAEPPPLGPINPAKTIQRAKGLAEQHDERVEIMRELSESE